MILGKKKAFSLTELLIVLVIIGVIFAAMAPIVTKRHIAETSESESIWNFVANDAEKDVFFDPGVETWTSSVYVGYTPSSKNDNAGKLVLNAGNLTYDGGEGSRNHNQPQLQFRFSPNPSQQGKGVNAADLLVLSNNLFFGTDPSLAKGQHNTIYGFSNLENVVNMNNTTVLGAHAMSKAKLTQSGANHHIIAAGSHAGYYLGKTDSSDVVSDTFIGAGAGSGSAQVKNAPNANIALGYQSMSKENNSGSHNVFAGIQTGNGFNNANASYNTIVGSSYYGKNAAYNTIVGYGVYAQGDTDIKYMTAIGYGACGSIGGNNTSKIVCLGYNSAYTSNNSPSRVTTDGGEHIFIGGVPNSTNTKGFPGRAVLEVHNNGDRGNVVLNSNLVVRGNYYPADNAESKIVYNTLTDTKTIGAENAYYRCNGDTLRSILSYRGYACNQMTTSNPKSINVWQKGGDCSSDTEYPKGNGCPNITSDRRLKNIISENNDGLDKLEQLVPYNYVYKSDKTRTPHTGVIAQDLQQVFPISVSKDSKGFLQIRWDEMFYALINSIKQLSAKVDELTGKISEMSKDVLSINSKQNDIQKELKVLNNRINKLERK